MRNRLATLFLVSTVFLLVFVALFLLRGADDNRLFSWAWAFAKIDASRIYLFLIAGLALSFFLSRTAIPDNYHVPFLAALSFGAILPFWGEPEIIVDTSRYFTQAKHLDVYGTGYFLKEWGKAIPAWTDMPLVPFLYGLIFKLLGEHRIAIQLFTTALFSLTTVLTYLVGKTLWDRETGFSAGLLLLGIPYLLTQVPLMLVDVPTMFFLILAVVLFLNALSKGGPVRTAGAVAAIVLSVLTKYSAWFMLSVLGVALFAGHVRSAGTGGRGVIQRGAFILLIAAALSGAMLLLNYAVVSGQAGLLLQYQKPGLARWGESFVSTFLFQVHPFITASALVSLVVAVRKRDARYAIISWLVLLVVLFGIRRIRYTLPVFPMLALMAGYGLQIVRQGELRRFLVFGTAATSLIIAFFAYLPFAQSMSAVNLRRAGEYLNTLPSNEVEVITLAPKDPVVNPAVSVPLLDLYTDKQLRYHYRPASSPTNQETERSSLRFTWEYRNPAYYAAPPAAAAGVPIVVLSDVTDDSLPEQLHRRLAGYRLSQSFRTHEGIFRYHTGVRIYQTAPVAARAEEIHE